MDAVCKFYPAPPEGRDFQWRDCRKAVDTYLRGIKFSEQRIDSRGSDILAMSVFDSRLEKQRAHQFDWISVAEYILFKTGEKQQNVNLDRQVK
ncbi:unnamed protein product, partial [Pocillopora meandrina]